MCGRYTNLYTWRDLVALYRLTDPEPPAGFKARYNLAPSQLALVIRMGKDDLREAAMLRWGLIPSWAKEKGRQLINARAETVATVPMFRGAFKRHRCLVPASGFFEWAAVKGGKGKQPYYITTKDGSPLTFAGLWEHWTDPETTEPVETFTIITTDANDLLRPIHDRMPVILAPEDHAAWLAAADTTIPMALLQPRGARDQPVPSEGMSAYPISTKVNSPRNDDPSVIERLRDCLKTGCSLCLGVIQAVDVDPSDAWPDGQDREEDPALSERPHG